MADYDSAVTEARTLVKRSETDQWRLSQLTWENAASYGQGGKKTIGQWARDIAVDDSYASRLWAMWERFGLDQTRSLPPFNEAYKEISPHSTYQPRHQQPQPLEPVYGPPPPNAPQDPVERAAAAREYPEATSSPTQVDVLSALVKAKQDVHIATRIAAQAGLAGSNDEGITQLADEVAEALGQLIRLNNGATLDQELEDILKGD